MADTYAIIESGGKQYRAEKGTTLVVDRLPADEGAKVNLRAVMFRGADDVVLESDKLEKVKVEATVAGHERGEKIRVFKYRAKKGYRKRAGPSLGADPARGHRGEDADPEARGKAGVGSRQPEPAAAKKTPAKRPAAKKPAAKKAPAKKKPAAKKES